LLGKYSSPAINGFLKRDPIEEVLIKGINSKQNEWVYNERVINLEDEEEEEEEEEDEDE